MNIIYFIIGMGFGTFFGIMLSAMLSISKRWSEMEDAYEEEGKDESRRSDKFPG